MKTSHAPLARRPARYRRAIPGRRRGVARRAASGMTLTAALLLLLAACSGEAPPPSPVFHAEGNPERLSDWGVMRAGGGVLTLAEGVHPYDLATPLFSDYALKLRTITLPEGRAATYSAEGAFDLPVGTIITKTFYYPTSDADWRGNVTVGEERAPMGGVLALGGLRLIETRILARRAEGWVALPYVWNEAQTDAILKRTGDMIPLTLHRPDGREEPVSYLVPNQNQCAGCHATDHTSRAIEPIGIKARHLNKPSSFAAGVNQLDRWIMAGLLDGDFNGADTPPRNADWRDENETVEARARAWLDINCSHCHGPTGPAKASGLDLRPVAAGPALGLCKSPIAAGSGSGGRPYGIVPGDPDRSITVYRLETNDPAAMMPELGRSVAHEESAALIRQWIEEMTGGCA